MKLRTLVIYALGFTILASVAHAKKAPMERIEPIGKNDLSMSCNQLADEADKMETIIGSAPAGDVFGNDKVAKIGTDLATDVATDKARSEALKAGLGSRMAGAIGRLGGLAKSSRKKRANTNKASKQSAQERWYYIAGLYLGKACDLEPEETSSE